MRFFLKWSSEVINKTAKEAHLLEKKHGISFVPRKGDLL